jgi:hypothetical protein
MNVKRPRKYEVILSGSLNGGTTPREMLWSVLKERSVNSGILRIVDTENKIEGEFGIFQGTFVVGAVMKGGKKTGYDALKMLLAARTGNYKYINFVDPLPPDLDNIERIRLTTLISIWPNMPLSAEALSTKNSINRMRGITPETVNSKEREASLIDLKVMEQLRAWDERHMDMRARAFWSAFAAASCIAALLAG